MFQVPWVIWRGWGVLSVSKTLLDTAWYLSLCNNAKQQWSVISMEAPSKSRIVLKCWNRNRRKQTTYDVMCFAYYFSYIVLCMYFSFLEFIPDIMWKWVGLCSPGEGDIWKVKVTYFPLSQKAVAADLPTVSGLQTAFYIHSIIFVPQFWPSNRKFRANILYKQTWDILILKK